MPAAHAPAAAAVAASPAATSPAAAPVAAVDPIASLAPSLLGELRASGLIGTAQAVRPFRWTIVMTRPLRSPRRHRETYAGTPPGAPAGLSPMVREELDEAGSTKRTVRGVSVRGLVFLKAGDTRLDVRVSGLHMPLARGEQFRIEYDDGDGALVENCVVGGDVAAATVHRSIPGAATRIECAGTGRYKRIGVKVSAVVMYLHEPGVFVGVEQALDSPLGRLRSGVRVVSFEMQGR
ncbi:MAG: hypothetical protein LT102_15980 [Burkholderiaceae bacterium]|nr:hypothetical protein [Burkholderiaceae bacterium]